MLTMICLRFRASSELRRFCVLEARCSRRLISVSLPASAKAAKPGAAPEKLPAFLFAGAHATKRSIGLLGMPNVGKSTLFNALTETQRAEASNFPFCTIKPNVGLVTVRDPVLLKLAEVAKSAKIWPQVLEVIDIAGLVRGASKGEGLGNQFLANVRDATVLVHLVRCFRSDDIHHVELSVDPIRDVGIIQDELVMADLQDCERQRELLSKQLKRRRDDVELLSQMAMVERALEQLEAGRMAGFALVTPTEWPALRSLRLLSTKPTVYVCNVDEESAVSGNDLSELLHKHIASQFEGVKGKASTLVISAQIESEISQLPSLEERVEFLRSLGLEETGLQRIVRAARDVLGIGNFYTVGPTETRSWTILRGKTSAREAAGLIHSDIAKNFIKAEIVSVEDYVACGGDEALIKSRGLLRSEGPDYIVNENETVLFKHSG